MPKYLVQYEITEYTEEEIEDIDGEIIFEEIENTWEDALEVEAASEEEAREKVADSEGSLYNDFYIYDVEKVED